MLDEVVRLELGELEDVWWLSRTIDFDQGVANLSGPAWHKDGYKLYLTITLQKESGDWKLESVRGWHKGLAPPSDAICIELAVASLKAIHAALAGGHSFEAVGLSALRFINDAGVSEPSELTDLKGKLESGLPQYWTQLEKAWVSTAPVIVGDSLVFAMEFDRSGGRAVTEFVFARVGGEWKLERIRIDEKC